MTQAKEEDWPRICMHPQCRGTATPATAVCDRLYMGKVYYCDKHVQAAYRKQDNPLTNWKRL